MSDLRQVWEDGRIVPRIGDLARVVEDVPLEHGLLRRDQNVLVDHVAEGPPMYVGIRWKDDGGTHVMALQADKIEVVA